MLEVPLGGQLLAPHPLSAFAESWVLRVQLLAESWVMRVQLLAHPHSLGQVQHSTPTSTVSVRFQFTVYVFQFFWGWRFSRPGGCGALLGGGGGGGVACGA
jgi:hypothetical protein